MTEWPPLPLADRARTTFFATAITFLVSLAFGAGWWALLTAALIGFGTWKLTDRL